MRTLRRWEGAHAGEISRTSDHTSTQELQELALARHARGKVVSFANRSLTYPSSTTAEVVAPHLYGVTPDSEGEEILSGSFEPGSRPAPTSARCHP